MTEYREKIEMIPGHMQEHVLRYIERGYPVGGFLFAVLSNNFKEAVVRADDINQRAFVAYVQYLVWYAPSMCHGSPERYAAWIESGGLEGQQAIKEKGMAG